MKAFISALVILILFAGIATANDIYCLNVCDDIEENLRLSTESGAKNALTYLKNHEFLLRLSMNASYITEARVSIESLLAAHIHNDEYEIAHCAKDSLERIRRIKRALII